MRVLGTSSMSIGAIQKLRDTAWCGGFEPGVTQEELYTEKCVTEGGVKMALKSVT